VKTERLVRVQVDDRVVCGRLDGGWIAVMEGFYGAPTGERVALTQARLLAPVVPRTCIGIGTNYRAHAVEMGKPVPTVPKVFVMPWSVAAGNDDPIVLAPGSARVDHEAELAIVIGQDCKDVAVADALDVVLGYTCANDVTARDFQRSDKVFGRAKGFDGYLPLGPCVVRGLDPSDLRVRCWVDGQLKQDGRTSDMVFGVAELVSFVSGVMRLSPGDVIATGTPSGVSGLVAGQRVDVEIEGIGRLSNPVVAAGA
jgi:2-keto-4-pentenoate hydratase/2-oxohepta-3-ene-1,7-dioic acid hydratase in catechol pathway